MMDDFGNKLSDIEDARRDRDVARAQLAEHIRCAGVLKTWADDWLFRSRADKGRPPAPEDLRAHLSRRHKVIAGIYALADGRFWECERR